MTPSRRRHFRAFILAVVLVLTASFVFVEHARMVSWRLDACRDDTVDIVVRPLLVVPWQAARPWQTAEVEVVDTARGEQSGSDTACRLHRGHRLRLSWPLDAGSPEPHENWAVTARVRPPSGTANPVPFDYERWLFSRGIHGTGRVRNASRLASAPGTPLERARTTVRLLLQERKHAGVLTALAIGDKVGISDHQWSLLRRTGTVHLLVVSGLHVSLVAALGFLPGALAGRLLLSRMPRLRAHHAGLVTAGVSAVGYAWLSGGEVPALRAVTLLATASLLRLGGRRVDPWHLLAGVFLLIVGWAPLSLLSLGLWLSFGAVAVLTAAFANRVSAPASLRRVRDVGRMQCLLMPGLSPLLIVLTGSMAPVAALANLFAVPLVSLAVVPPLLVGCLVSGLSSQLANLCVRVADVALDGVLAALSWLAVQPVWLFTPTRNTASVVTLAAGAALLLPLSRRVRVLLTGCWLLAFTPGWPRLPEGEFRLTVLDVGQGSAAIVETRDRTLVYDAGPGAAGVDAGERIVAPSLASLPNSQPTLLLISHPDDDHAGGVGSLAQRFPHAAIAGSAGTGADQDCHELPPWRWNGVDFIPVAGNRLRNASTTNDRSCVLLVDNGRHAVLLTGDAGRDLEVATARAAGEVLQGRLEVLLVPHHGSASSSSNAFIRLLRPRIALISTARFSRYGHPHPRVVARYRRAGVRVVSTAQGGALRWRSDLPAAVARQRDDPLRYWSPRDST
ncbi:MAG: DNA internalization-related competence protein ComEC/Rec2 [Pseudomonadales bacterium]